MNNSETKEKETISAFNGKELFSYADSITLDEFRIKAKFFPQLCYLRYAIRNSITALIISLIVLLHSFNILTTIIAFGIIETIVLIYSRIKLDKYVIAYYNASAKENNLYEDHIYEKCLIRECKNATYKYYYSDVIMCIETDDSFYLKTNIKYLNPNIAKRNLDSNMISFIRETFKDINEQATDEQGVKRILEILLVKRVAKFLSFFTYLFIILCFSYAILINAFVGDDLLAYKYIFISLVFLPISLASLLINIKHRKLIERSSKNIKVAVIISIFIVFFSTLSLIPLKYRRDFSELNKYKDIIQVDLPSNGEFYEIITENVNFDKVSALVKFYKKEEYDSFYNKLKKSENWLNKKQLDSNLKKFIPENLQECHSNNKQCYYSIYIKKLNTYNEVPKDEGWYIISVMMYEPKYGKLKIEEDRYYVRN